MRTYSKNLFDLAVASVLILASSPVMLILFIINPLLSRGPAIYKQTRIGKDGVSFSIYKFRSMVHDAEVHTGPVLSKSDDNRVTTFGKFLRSTHMDELPQLFNVIMGDMSLVGPRPERPFFVDQYMKSVENYHIRMSVKPGMTGLAQINESYNVSVEKKLYWDIKYIRQHSLLLDIKIILITVWQIISRKLHVGIQKKEKSYRNL
jgi:lipopolysaccharide/colanic/teichoic acid biosynthesis glycosyltransferase